MSIATIPPTEAFRTMPERGLPTAARVDHKARTISGAKALQEGPLNAGDARPYRVDETSMNQLVALVNASTTGAKMRFAHPNMSRDGMGRHLGRATNARIVTPEDGSPRYVAIDAKLHESALRSPSGNLAQHVLDLATEAPEDFGLSIAPLLDSEAMNKIEPDEQGLVPIRLKALRAIDFVDEPAATSGGLFALDSGELPDLPAQVTRILDTFFADSPAEVIRSRFGEFLTRYLINRGEPDMTTAEVAAKVPSDKTPPTPGAKPEAKPAELSVATTDSAQAKAAAEQAKAAAEQAKAAAELERRSQVLAVCRLAKVDDATRDLMLSAGWDGKDCQAYLMRSGHLAAQNPPVGESAVKPTDKPKQAPEDQFAAEFEKDIKLFRQLGLSKEQYVTSRLKDLAAGVA